MAVDLRVGNQPASTTPLTVWAAYGAIWRALGGRWIGDSVPAERNHFDMDAATARELACLGVRQLTS